MNLTTSSQVERTMPFFKTTQFLSLKVRPKILIPPRKDQIRFYLTNNKGRSPKNSRFVFCTLAVSSALGYTFFKSEYKIPSIQEVFKSFIPSVSALSFKDNDNNQNRNKYNFIADVVEICAPAVVLVQAKGDKVISQHLKKSGALNNGSGFIVREDGLILTNAHVVKHAMKQPNLSLEVKLADGTTYDAVVEDMDLEADLATVRINKKNLPIIKLGNSKNLRPGEFVVAIGSPLTLSNSITSGVVSNSNRRSEELGIFRSQTLKKNAQMSYIQTDAPITFGNSGGPLVNLDGEVIGINAMKVTPGISFAIPVDYAKEFLQKSEEEKKKGVKTSQEFKNAEFGRKRYLGVTMITLEPEMIADMHHIGGSASQFIKHGVLIWRIMPGSPADLSGLRNGDIITDANGKPALSATNIYESLEQTGPLLLKVVRNGQVLQFKIEPESPD